MTGDPEQPRLVRRARSVEAAALAGLVFGGTFIATVGLVTRAPDPDAADRDIREWLADGRSDDTMLLAQQLTLVSIIAFLWFIGVFRRRVGGRVDEFTASVFLGSGLVLAALEAVGVSLLTAPTVVFTGDATRTVTAYVGAHAAGLTLMTIFANGLAGVFTLSSTTMIHRSGVFPRWLAIVGYVTAVALILSPFDLIEASALFPVWVMLVSLVVLIHRRELPGPGHPGTGQGGADTGQATGETV